MAKFSSFAGGFTGYDARVTSIPTLKVVGGTTSTLGGYKYHFFSTTGEFNVTDLPVAGATVSVLIVAGGGGGGNWSSGQQAGGGGAGGLLEVNNISLTVQSYTIMVGGGGAQNSQGANSSAFSYVAIGGGAGNVQGTTSVGGNGGSGGAPGAYGTYSISTNTIGKGVYPGSTYLSQARQGYDSSAGFSFNWGGAGAGGGANGAGGGTGGVGGPGYYTANFAQFGDSANLGTFASGGSAYWDQGQGNASPGRQFGGGGYVGNTLGLINTGGGGGGPINASGSIGGSGVVIIRYPFSG